MKHTIFDCIIKSCQNSTIRMEDINHESFFGEQILVPAPIDEVDILEYIESLTSEFMESTYKMAIVNGCIAKVDIDVMDCMLDTEDIAYASLYTYSTYAEVMTHLSRLGKKNALYLVSKDYDAASYLTSYSIMELKREG